MEERQPGITSGCFT